MFPGDEASSGDLRRLMVEAVAAGSIVMTLALVLDPSAPGRSVVSPHPLWLAVLVLATQYGLRGLIASLTACIAMVGIASLCVGEGLGWIGALSTSGSNLVAFTGAIAVAWVAGGHERRKAALSRQSHDATARADEAQTSFNSLRGVADGLTRQLDRAQLSISYVRSIAERLEGNDALVAADAAIELALSRLGARVGAVLLHDGARLRVFTHRGVWSSDSPVPPDVVHDNTADRAFRRFTAVTALDLEQVAELDSDLAAPIPGKDGKPCGVLVVRNMALDLELASVEQYQAALADMTAVARWVSRPVADVVLARPSSARLSPVSAVPSKNARRATDAA